MDRCRSSFTTWVDNLFVVEGQKIKINNKIKIIQRLQFEYTDLILSQIKTYVHIKFSLIKFIILLSTYIKIKVSINKVITIINFKII